MAKLYNQNTQQFEFISDDNAHEKLADTASPYALDNEDQHFIENEDGEIEELDAAGAMNAVENRPGTRYMSLDGKLLRDDQAKYETAPQIAKTIGEGMARSVTLGMSDPILAKIYKETGFDDPREIKRRQEENILLSTGAELGTDVATLVPAFFKKGGAKVGSLIAKEGADLAEKEALERLEKEAIKDGLEKPVTELIEEESKAIISKQGLFAGAKLGTKKILSQAPNYIPNKVVSIGQTGGEYVSKAHGLLGEKIGKLISKDSVGTLASLAITGGLMTGIRSASDKIESVVSNNPDFTAESFMSDVQDVGHDMLKGASIGLIIGSMPAALMISGKGAVNASSSVYKKGKNIISDFSDWVLSKGSKESLVVENIIKDLDVIPKQLGPFGNPSIRLRINEEGNFSTIVDKKYVTLDYPKAESRILDLDNPEQAGKQLEEVLQVRDFAMFFNPKKASNSGKTLDTEIQNTLRLADSWPSMKKLAILTESNDRTLRAIPYVYEQADKVMVKLRAGDRSKKTLDKLEGIKKALANLSRYPKAKAFIFNPKKSYDKTLISTIFPAYKKNDFIFIHSPEKMADVIHAERTDVVKGIDSKYLEDFPSWVRSFIKWAGGNQSFFDRVKGEKLTDAANFIRTHSIKDKFFPSITKLSEESDKLKTIGILKMDDGLTALENKLMESGKQFNPEYFHAQIEKMKSPFEFYDSFGSAGKAKPWAQEAYDSLTKIQNMFEGYDVPNDHIQNSLFKIDPATSINSLNAKELRKIKTAIDQYINYTSSTTANNTMVDGVLKNARWLVDNAIMQEGAKIGNTAKAINLYTQGKKDYGLASDVLYLTGIATKRAMANNDLSIQAGLHSSYQGLAGAKMGEAIGSAISTHAPSGAAGAIISGLSGVGAMTGAGLGIGASLVAKEYGHFFKGHIQYKLAQKNINTAVNIDKAVNSVMVRGARLPLKIASMYASGRDPKEEYERDLKNITELSSNMETTKKKIRIENQELFDNAPEIGEAILAQSAAAINFLAQKLPQNPDPQSGYEWSPSTYEMAKYERYKLAATNVQSILDHFAQSYLSSEEIEVLRYIYPQIYSLLKNQVINNWGKVKMTPEKSSFFKQVFGIGSAQDSMIYNSDPNRAPNSLDQNKPLRKSYNEFSGQQQTKSEIIGTK